MSVTFSSGVETKSLIKDIIYLVATRTRPEIPILNVELLNTQRANCGERQKKTD